MLTQLLPCDDKPSEFMLSWLEHPFALTERLQQSTGDANLMVLDQFWRTAGWWEKAVLGLDVQPVFQRDIIMFSGATACWFARSVIPEATFKANEVLFERLQQESLGKLVFNEQLIERQSMHHYPVDYRCMEFYWPGFPCQKSTGTLWIKQSNFVVREQYPFYLSELFLPGFAQVVR